MDRFNALRAFVRLTERTSFTAVAHEMRVRQSTVSKWVAALEEELGIQLLARTTRTVRITDAGRSFAIDAREILGTYDSARQRLQPGQQLRGRLRISVPVVFGRLFVVGVVQTLMRRHPDLEIQMSFSDRYVNLVEDNIDVAVRVGASVDSTLRQFRLGGTARVVVASPNYTAQHGTPSEPEQLAQHVCLVHRGLPHDAAWSFSDPKGGAVTRVAVRGRFGADNSEALLAMATADFGIAMLASWLVQDDLTAGRLVALLPAWSLPHAPIAALTLPSRHPPPAIAAFVDTLRSALAPIMPAQTVPTPGP